MSALQISDDIETLFSFELLVENINIYTAGKVSNELAVGVRLLDFPTLLIYMPEERRRRGEAHREEDDVRDEHVFNRGKCCFFKMNLDSLHTHLSNTPLYTMLLDVKEEIPKLIGTSLISLSTVMKRIKQDVTEQGVSSPSSHGERGIVGVCSLTGEKIGEMCLSYKLQSVGGNVLQHVTERRGGKCMNVQESSVQEQDEPDLCRNKTSKLGEMLQNEDKQEGSDCVFTQSEEKEAKQTQERCKEEDFEDVSAIFCPPRLFFCNSAEERSKNETSQSLNSAGFHFEEVEGDETESVSCPASVQKEKCVAKTPENKRTSAVTSNILRDVVQQLPLLNALLVELSQLSGETTQQPLSVHPNLAWIYRPASAEPSQRTRQAISPDLKSSKSQKNCSTPLFKHTSSVEKEKLEEGKICSTTLRKKLVFGTTKTFNLRMKQVSPVRGKQRECVELMQSKTQKKMLFKKGSRRKSDLKRASNLNVDIQTAVESVREDSLKQESHKHSLRNSEKAPLSEFIDIPTVRGNISAKNKDDSERQSESNHSQCDRQAGDAESSRGRSSKSSISDSAGEESEDREEEEEEEEDYPDDFNSLEPSDGYSPDPMSSPESSRAKTPKSPTRLLSDSSSEGVHKRVALRVPVPIPASRSPPQRALRGTHIIRARTSASALSVSSDDADKDTSASVQTVLSRKQTSERSRVDSSVSSGGQRSESNNSSRGAPAFSVGSVSSFELQEAEDEEDELGSLDFRKEYKHISELVANKLPGYTM
ncbi:microtubule-associated protein 10 [Halichoeres trimaculatus]|uniref:microtubule-associated protein 10 n=1 Tax=Halichoeres trimaculatus TaxID=147232 RepID=UPI003D9F0282